MVNVLPDPSDSYHVRARVARSVYTVRWPMRLAGSKKNQKKIRRPKLDTGFVVEGPVRLRSWGTARQAG